MYGPDLARYHAAHASMLAREAATTLVDELAAAGLRHGTVADVGCGDGTLAELLVQAGYDVLAVDPSPAFLDLVAHRAPTARRVQDTAAHVELPAGLSAVACVGEVLAYDLDVDLDEALASFRAALRSGGVVLLDLPGPGRHDLEPVVVHSDDDAVLVMRTEEVGYRLVREITVFTTVEDRTYRRSDEVHELRLYEAADVRSALARAGFVAVRQLDRYGAAGPRFHHGWSGFIASRP